MKSANCIACGCRRPHWLQTFDLRARWHEFGILRCLHCGLGRTEPKPKDPYLEAAQTQVDIPNAEAIRDDLERHPVRSPWAREVARVLIERRAPEDILDVGCGEGDLLDEL